MRFRPTRQQAMGRGGYLGALVGLAGFVVVSVFGLTGVIHHLGVPKHVVLLLPVWTWLGGIVSGGLLGPVLGRHAGADVDDQGIRSVPRSMGGHTDWQSIDDLRAERRGGRTRVALYFDSGQIGWLRAPYSGRFLASDPEFERKVFMLRNVLATHRSITSRQRLRRG